MPRLQLPANGDAAIGTDGGVNNDLSTEYPPLGGNGNEFNITNFMYDVNSDWFMNPT
jgi:hypothetical protein